MPQIAYHGTSDLRWDKAGPGTLYLTVNREDAENYADEAAVNDYPEDHEEGMAPPSTAIIVEFQMTDILALPDAQMSPDWGWGDLHEGATWQDSLAAVGSFCVEDFRAKNLGKVTRAFS